jgi:hypothetical protein
MAERLFLFLQMEFPWELGPSDGRYLLRARVAGEAERVVVLDTLGARPRASARGLRWTTSRRSRARTRLAQPMPEPTPVATARATIVDPVPLSAERQARAWLADLDAEREASAAVAVLNRVLHSHRIASADPYIHEVSPAQALVIRAGWGGGEQVAGGRWLHARELQFTVSQFAASKRRRTGARLRAGADRSAALRHEERLAELLGARGSALLCEELALRARLDLDQGRLPHGAIELQAAYTAALAELRSEQRQDLAIRIAELERLHAGVAAQAGKALAGTEAETTGADGPPAGPEEEVLRHALERLEAALRARTALTSRLR